MMNGIELIIDKNEILMNFVFEVDGANGPKLFASTLTRIIMEIMSNFLLLKLLLSKLAGFELILKVSEV